MADLALIQEAANRGVLPDSMQPLYQEAVKRGLIQQPEGSHIKGALAGAMDVGSHMVTAIPTGLTELAGLIKGGGQEALSAALPAGTVSPGEGAFNTAQDWGDAARAFFDKPRFSIGDPEMNGSSTQESRALFNQGAGHVLNAVNEAGDAAVSGLSRARRAIGQTILPKGMQPSDADYARREAGERLWTNLGLNALQGILGSKALGAEPEAEEAGAAGEAPAPEATAPAVDPEHPVTQARGLGYDLPPSEAAYRGAQAPVGKILESIAGPDKMRVLAAENAQQLTNKLALEDVPTLPQDAGEITQSMLDSARKPYNEAYEAVRQVGQVPTDPTFKDAAASVGDFDPSKVPEGFPMSPVQQKILALRKQYSQVDSFDSGWALNEIKGLRASARKSFHASDDPSAPEYANYADLGAAQRQMADTIENQIDRYASSRPEGFEDPDLVPKFQDARQKLAVINTLEDAIKPGTSDVSAPALARMYNKKVPLSGNLEQIAQAANNFPRILTDPARLNKAPLSRFETGAVGIGGGAALWMHNPYLGAAALGTGLGRLGLRHALLSEVYQRGLVPGLPPNALLSGALPPALLAGAGANQQPSGGP